MFFVYFSFFFYFFIFIRKGFFCKQSTQSIKQIQKNSKKLLMTVNKNMLDNQGQLQDNSRSKLLGLTFHELKVNRSLTGLRYYMVS